MIYRATLTNGDTHLVDVDARTVTPGDSNSTDAAARLVAGYTEYLLAIGGLVGPQVDELVGVRGDWTDPQGPLAAMIQSARTSRLGLVTFEPVTVEGVPSPVDPDVAEGPEAP